MGAVGMASMMITPLAHADIAGVASVVDADTCEDAAGRTWRCGQRAALVLQSVIERRTVTCHQRHIDCMVATLPSVSRVTSTSASGSSARAWRWRIASTQRPTSMPRKQPPLPTAACGPARARLPGIRARSTARVGEASNLSVRIEPLPDRKRHNVTFVSIKQEFNTTTSMGRWTHQPQLEM
jgi:hypothetical protein